MSGFAISVMATALALVVIAYLGRLPEAPTCPSCRGITGEADRYWPGGRTLSYVSTTAVRQCACCGWRGRMRWRPWAPRVRSRR